LNMVRVFEEQVIKITEQKLNETLEKLKGDKLLQRKFRELTDISATLKRLDVIIKESSSLDSRGKWIEKRDKLMEKRDEIYFKIENEGFEREWIITIVKYESENLEKVLNDARESARKKYFWDASFDDIDIFDKRWELVEQQIKQAKMNYLEGV